MEGKGIRSLKPIPRFSGLVSKLSSTHQKSQNKKMGHFLSSFEFPTNSVKKSSLEKPCCSCEPFSFSGLCCALVHDDQSWFELVLGSSRAMTSGQSHYSLILQRWSSLFSNPWRVPKPASVGMHVLHHCTVKWNGSERTLWYLVLCSAPLAWK